MPEDQMNSVASQTGDVMDTWNEREEKALVRKIDLRIFPIMIILFILNFIDRNNFANARLKGLEEDLNLTDVQYQTCISILLVGYVAMQIPSNMVLSKLSRPSWYICACVAVWGIISACTGTVQNATGAILCRFFLGCVEASLFPGAIYLLARWYTRKEMQLRVTILNGGNLAAQAFGGLIAAGILGDMEGTAGLRAWRWLFIIEGAITVACAGAAVMILPDYPQTTRWLSEREKMIAQMRLALDAGVVEAVEDESALHGLKLAVMDPKVWLLGITYHATIMALSFSFFFPTITASLGYGTTETLLLTAPPWIWAIVFSIPNALHADKTGERFWHYTFPAVICIVGYIISMTTTTTAPRYFAMFMMTTGYACGFLMLAWISNTIVRPASKKAAAIAIVNAMGNIGSIPGSYGKFPISRKLQPSHMFYKTKLTVRTIWPSKWGPYYVKSFGAELAIFAFAIACAFLLRMYLKHLNKRLEAGKQIAFEVTNVVATRTGELEGKPAGSVVDDARNFRYLY